MTGFSGVLFLCFEFYSLREVKVELGALKREVKVDLSEIKQEIRSQLVETRTVRVEQTARLDRLYNSLIDAQKEARAQSKNEDERYYKLLLQLEKKWK